MRSLPLTTRALIVLTVVAAALLSGYAALALPAHGNHLWWVVFLCAAMGGEALRVSSDGESGAVAEFTFSMAVLVAAIPLFGLVVTSVISFASLAVVDIARGGSRRPNRGRLSSSEKSRMLTIDRIASASLTKRASMQASVLTIG
jgi:hypothetical protein